MKVVVAPDKFAGTLTAAEAAQAMMSGWRSVRPGDDIVARPMADGGEGTLAVVAGAHPDARICRAQVVDPRGRPLTASWLLLDDGTALVEAAEACGISWLAEEDRDPLRLTSYGVGELLRAVASEAERIVVGLGGSATVDGGAGAAAALGHRLLDLHGRDIGHGGAHLLDVARVVLGHQLGADVIIAVDVDNPLLGERGAAPVFGPQKGAGPEDVALLARGLSRYADVVERDVPGGPWRDLPGAGAAGGLGFGLAAFAGGSLTVGSAAVADLVGLDEAIADADWVLTGEGSLDRQTAAGKAPAYVQQRARRCGARVGAVAGRFDSSAADDFDVVRALGPEGMNRSAELVTERAAEIASEITHREADSSP